MKRIQLFLFSLLFLSFFAGLSADPLPVTGVWRTYSDDGKEESTVEIYEQGGKIYGKVTGLVDPNDKDGKPARCTACEGAEKDKPVLGLVIIKGLQADGDKWSGGRILDPNDGVWYKCLLKAVEGGKKLEVRGYVGFSLIGRSQYWVKK
ncbi:DUF2147 domain-containing protein [Leptospira wolffii]|uniref:DUF2147 domain-containing protein n=1 Tax=Leptospira wolffii TaxID=409998 RepID=A0A2M9Z7U2_9LEPT|nr:DUF2147 domain-containing protein [Leptospira wolffii]EPG66390.1 PF09917 family protein [Leptospira wolffii serovar Khorat str. Khorat-H2]PJZ64454.1 DUF2147 domain-containing protein [Leptospira wolffii]TGK54856.1 DUF2147 domain-containing protein [Leptospira wolffii]TGK65388.1 DUF2147 domain-containing protein [Leptospira wolffii]TGK70778.1 DUF2147 domain-containing protein [Leptospira wolffii]